MMTFSFHNYHSRLTAPRALPFDATIRDDAETRNLRWRVVALANFLFIFIYVALFVCVIVHKFELYQSVYSLEKS